MMETKLEFAQQYTFVIQGYENADDDVYVLVKDRLSGDNVRVFISPEQTIELAKALLAAAGAQPVITTRGISSADFEGTGDTAQTESDESPTWTEDCYPEDVRNQDNPDFEWGTDDTSK